MARISEKTIDKIYEVPLTEAIGKIYNDTSYKINGNIAKGNSPFNSERTSSFSVINSKGIWKDFSSGKGGNNFISFVMEYKKVDYPEAVKICAEALNIAIEYEEETEAAKEKREKKQTALQLLDKTSKLFQQNFQQASSENWWKQYMQDRGFTEETLQSFQIGYSLHGQLYEIFKEQGVVTLAEEVSLLNKDASGNYYSVFRDRIMFPICDLRGHCVGFGGRVNPQYVQKCESEGKKAPAKYLNSAENPYFNKSKLLYGLHLARKSMFDTKEVYLVEGYTDVMRMHQIGLLQTVAPMGTALTDEQISIIKKHCNKVILFRDFDPAGQQAAFRDMKILLKAGLFVEILPNPSEGGAKSDPDTIGLREDAFEYIKSSKTDALLYFVKRKYEQLKAEQGFEESGKKKKFRFLPELAKKFSDYVVDIVSVISDNYTKENYIEIICDNFEVSKKSVLDSLKQETKSERKQFYGQDIAEIYDFPAEIENPNEFADDIMQYGIFQTNNQIYALVGKDDYFFKSVSNFSIEIIQHMQDESHPLKLIRICNIFGREIIFDTLSPNINTVQGFFNLMTSFGNFNYQGSNTVHQKLLTYLFNKMGHGRRIDTLGWQPEGFWVWNNQIIIPKKRIENINSEGLFKYKDECYYIPSANKIYTNNAYKFLSQKKFIAIPTEISLEKYLFQMVKVHRRHAYSAILFAISSLFQDVVVNHLNFFPILFLYGIGSSGKDNLGAAVQSFVGKPQSAISLENGLSTGKASIREFAQFSNGISQLSEYKRGYAQTDGMLKSLWDRVGYKRGTIDSKVSTDEVPILSSVIITGNEFPESQPLLMRVVLEEMNKNEFTEEEFREFDKLKSIINKGISSLSNELLEFRENVENDFIEEYKRTKLQLNTSEDFKGTVGRIIENLSVLTTFYKLFNSYGIHFPFSFPELLDHWKKVVTNINNKLSSASSFSKFWDCFLFCMRNRSGQENITIDYNYKEEGGKLLFNFTTIFGIVQRQWYSQYHEAAPNKTEMRRLLKDEKSYVGEKKSERINTQVNSSTSAIIIDINLLSIREEILNEIEFQRLKKNPNSTLITDDDSPF
ncbi:DNA primase [Capnocytophaga canimorsus]|uniref:DNA primase n=1 Tax=Capnocytophaga canimorsus TaxID=28188 RepID=UPI0028E8A130|nr:DNA primase [Capnocytophaga canimorsus]MDT9499156.1 DNA primase [Capnocytophaga canimorsus]